MPRTELTGVGYYTVHLMRALFAREDGFDFRLFACAAGPPPDAVRDLARRVTRARFVWWPTRLKTSLWTRLEWPPIEWFTGPVDIAHGGFHLLPASRQAKRTVTVFDLTNIRHPETHVPSQRRVHLRMLEHAVPRADALVAISRSSAADLVELLGAAPEKVHVVYGGVCCEEFCKEWDQEAFGALKRRLGIGREYFIHLGTLEPRKNIPRLLEAYARLRQRFKDYPELVLAGKTGWMYEPIFKAIESLGLKNDVVQTGYISREDAVLLLRGAYGCVYPSLYEGFGLPVLEAMAARTPVLTSSVSSMPEVIGETGITVNPESVDEIEAGMAELLEKRDAALERTEAAFERAKRFTWEDSAASLAAAFRAVAG